MTNRYISVDVDIDLSEYEDEILNALTDDDLIEEVDRRGIKPMVIVEMPSLVGRPKYKVRDILADLVELPHSSSVDQILYELRKLAQ